MALLRELLRFGLIGLAATGLHFALLTLLVERGGLPPPTANGVAFLGALTVTYLGQSLWVFPGRSRHSPRQMLRFALSLVLGLAANMAIMALCTQVLGFDYRTGFIIGVATVPALSFTINRSWVFAAT
jgi:putative flippase GtrA